MSDNLRGMILAIIIGLFVYLIAGSFVNSQQAILLGLIAVMVTLWTNEVLPLGVVSLFPIVLFPAFDILTTNAVAANYSKSIIFLFLGGFMLAIAVEKTLLHQMISGRMLRLFPNTARGVIFSLALTSAVLSSFLSNTTTTLLLMPLALFLTDNNGLKMRFALAIAYGASIGGIITPIGTPPNLILFGLFEELKIPEIPFMQWVVLVLPLAMIMHFFVSWVLSIGTKNEMVSRKELSKTLTDDQKKVALALLGLIVLLVLNSPIKPIYSGLGLNEKGILLAFGLLMFMPPFNILNWSDSKKIPYEIIFLFGAGFSIAMAVTSTGLADVLAQTLQALTNLPPVILLIIVASLVTFTTEITSNTALISMILPVIYAITQKNGLDVRLFMMVATVCASYAFMLPIATPPNAIAMSSGVVHVKTMAKYGFVFNMFGITLISFLAITYWMFFL